MKGRWVLGLILALALISVLGVFVARSFGRTAPDPVPMVPPSSAPPAPHRTAYPLPAPPAESSAPPRTEDVAPIDNEPIPRDVALAFSTSASRVMGQVRSECVDPWMAADDLDEVEFALNTLVVDGRVVDIELLTVLDALPEDVLACVRDVAWSNDWPDVQMKGEVRFQRSLHAKRRSVSEDAL